MFKHKVLEYVRKSSDCVLAQINLKSPSFMIKLWARLHRLGTKYSIKLQTTNDVSSLLAKRLSSYENFLTYTVFRMEDQDKLLQQGAP